MSLCVKTCIIYWYFFLLQKLSCSYSVWLGIIDSFCEVLMKKGGEEEEEEQLKMILNKALSVAETVLREEPLKVVTSLLHIRWRVIVVLLWLLLLFIIRLELLKQTRDIVSKYCTLASTCTCLCVCMYIELLQNLTQNIHIHVHCQLTHAMCMHIIHTINVKYSMRIICNIVSFRLTSSQILAH